MVNTAVLANAAMETALHVKKSVISPFIAVGINALISAIMVHVTLAHWNQKSLADVKKHTSQCLVEEKGLLSRQNALDLVKLNTNVVIVRKMFILAILEIAHLVKQYAIKFSPNADMNVKLHVMNMLPLYSNKLKNQPHLGKYNLQRLK